MFNKNHPALNFISRYKFIILAVIAGLILLLFMRGCHRDELAAFKGLMKQQQAQMQEQYDAQIKGLENTISSLNKDITESKKTNNILKIKISDKQKKMEAVRPPEGMDEIQKRFIALGFSSIICR